MRNNGIFMIKPSLLTKITERNTNAQAFNLIFSPSESSTLLSLLVHTLCLAQI